MAKWIELGICPVKIIIKEIEDLTNNNYLLHVSFKKYDSVK